MKFDNSNIIGRDTEIKNLFSVLKNQSVVLLSHRRMGKTYLLKKITTIHPADFVPVFFIVEGKSSPEEFVHDLYRQLVDDKLIKVTKSKKFSDWYENNFAGMQLKDMKLPSFRNHWKEAIKKIIEDLIIAQQGKNVLIMIDEFPMMLYKYTREYKLANEAIEMRDTLREIRQVYGDKGIKFIFCGSIGINVVIDILRREYGYAGEPINDMSIEILDAMNPEDAEMLARHLIKSKDIIIASKDEDIIKVLCKEVNYLPFYIDLIIKELYIYNIPFTHENIIKGVKRLISGPGNQAQFNHFSDRISTYYEENIKIISKQILNWLSCQKIYKSEDEIANMLSAKQSIQIDKIKQILKKLFDDLYIDRILKDGKRFYKFKYSLLKKWWMINFG